MDFTLPPQASCLPHSKTKVSYFYDDNIGNFHYGAGHPMKPQRIRMTDNLVLNYGLYPHLDVYRPTQATFREMTKFHSDDYVSFLHRVTFQGNAAETEKRKFNINDDCPPFDGLYEFCALSAGGSIDGASKLNHGESDIAINWGGGLHHAKKMEASGFCYINDIVLGILELLRYHQRVLYIDCDVHHGDGVEEAFYTTDRVMTVSFHKFGGFFPGTGDLTDIGYDKGRYYSVNVPLQQGINDETYHSIFEPVIRHIMEWYRPGAVVLQLGADSLAGDRLGCFNLSMKGHARCLSFVKKFNVPILVLGGGGYTIRNVARAWTYETSLAVGVELPEELPINDYLEYFGPEYRLDVPATNMVNLNTRYMLEKTTSRIIENLRHLPFAPSVQIQDIPNEINVDLEKDENQDPDHRIPAHQYNTFATFDPVEDGARYRDSNLLLSASNTTGTMNLKDRGLTNAASAKEKLAGLVREKGKDRKNISVGERE